MNGIVAVLYMWHVSLAGQVNMYITICEIDCQSRFDAWRQVAQGWCAGMTLRDGMWREVGGGFRMGNTCTPMADSYQCMAKPTTIL